MSTDSPDGPDNPDDDGKKRRRGRRRRRRGKGKSKPTKTTPAAETPALTPELELAMAAGLSRRVFDASATQGTIETRSAGGRSSRAARSRRRSGRRGRNSGPAIPPVPDAEAASFGTTWWGKKWLSAIEGVSTAYANRLPRGLSYAQHGHVKNVKVTAGKVEAHVSGRRPQPYKVTIQLRQLTRSQWKKVIEMLGDRASFAASLLAGTMPEQITDIFEQCGLSLFPQRHRDIKATCSCPDWANPCKHIAATHYLIGEALDRDPFLILTLRGRTRDAVLSGLRAERSGVDLDETGGSGSKDQSGVSVGQLDPAEFYSVQDDLGDFRFQITQPEMELSVLRRIGTLSAWRGETPLSSMFTNLYRATSERAEGVGLREVPTPAEPVDSYPAEDERDTRAEPKPRVEASQPEPVLEEPEPAEAPAEDAEADPVHYLQAVEGAEIVAAIGAAEDDEPGDEGESRPDGPTVLVRRRTADKKPRGRKDTSEKEKAGSRRKRKATREPRESREPREAHEPAPPPVEAAAAEDPDEAALEARIASLIAESSELAEQPETARQILWALQAHGSATSRQLARRTRMKKAAISELLETLLEVGLVTESGEGDRRRFAFAGEH